MNSIDDALWIVNLGELNKIANSISLIDFLLSYLNYDSYLIRHSEGEFSK